MTPDVPTTPCLPLIQINRKLKCFKTKLGVLLYLPIREYSGAHKDHVLVGKGKVVLEELLCIEGLN